MMSFRSGRLLDRALPTGTVWLMTGNAEAKGRQEIFIQQTPQALKALRETALVAAVEGFPGEFTLSDLERGCPGVSRDMVRRVLRDLQRAGKVVCLGRGPGALWRREGNTSKKG